MNVIEINIFQSNVSIPYYTLIVMLEKYVYLDFFWVNLLTRKEEKVGVVLPGVTTECNEERTRFEIKCQGPGSNRFIKTDEAKIFISAHEIRQRVEKEGCDNIVAVSQGNYVVPVSL